MHRHTQRQLNIQRERELEPRTHTYMLGRHTIKVVIFTRRRNEARIKETLPVWVESVWCWTKESNFGRPNSENIQDAYRIWRANVLIWRDATELLIFSFKFNFMPAIFLYAFACHKVSFASSDILMSILDAFIPFSNQINETICGQHNLI